MLSKKALGISVFVECIGCFAILGGFLEGISGGFLEGSVRLLGNGFLGSKKYLFRRLWVTSGKGVWCRGAGSKATGPWRP